MVMAEAHRFEERRQWHLPSHLPSPSAERAHNLQSIEAQHLEAFR